MVQDQPPRHVLTAYEVRDEYGIPISTRRQWRAEGRRGRTTFRCLFDNPVFGDHSPLVLGWGEDQLWPIVDRLAPWLPDNLTVGMTLAIAGIARSIVTEAKTTGLWSHYSRSKKRYARGRYHDGDPRNSYAFVVYGMDVLHAGGLVEHVMGDWGLRRESITRATRELTELIGDLCDPDEPRGLTPKVELIVLRSREDEDGKKHPLEYIETAETTRMRAEMEIINEALARLKVYRCGKLMDIPILRRIFNESLDRGGRLYCNGESYQNLAAEKRPYLKIAIDGVLQPMVEVDYGGLHARMAYGEARKRTPSGDPYDIDGLPRGMTKEAFLTMLNARNEIASIGAIAAKYGDDEALAEIKGRRRGQDCSGLHSYTARMMRAIRKRHHKIREFFNSDCGARFQRLDSDMAVEVLLAMIELTGRCPLPMHDSFIVAKIDEGLLRHVMNQVAQRRGLRLKLKITRPIECTSESDPFTQPVCAHDIPTLPSIHMGVSLSLNRENRNHEASVFQKDLSRNSVTERTKPL
jgi:hypothetical protein